MSESKSDLFDPRAMGTNYDYSSEVEDDCDFSFAFDDPNFSDRVLRIEMFSEPVKSTSGFTDLLTGPERARTLHVSSAVLAARSSFFYKLFSTQKMESAVRVEIRVSEETAFMELLNFIYSNKLRVKNVPDVLDVLKVADKFEVALCIKHCGRLLRNLPMTPESVRVYLDLSSTILQAKAFKPLTVAVKQFYAVHYKDITRFRREALGLPLASVEAILASDDLHVKFENDVYRFVLDWALVHYPKQKKKRREIIATRLAKFIRFPYITRWQLAEFLTCKEFDPKFAQKAVLEALSFKAEVPNTVPIRDENSILNRWFVERAYKIRPIKMIENRHPVPNCVLYLDLKRDLCASSFPSARIFSEPFYLGGHGYQLFFLEAKCSRDGFGLYLFMQQYGAHPTFAFNYKFSAMSKRTNEFLSTSERSCTYTNGMSIGWRNLLRVPWTRFIAEDSIWFIDGVLHLKVEISYDM